MVWKCCVPGCRSGYVTRISGSVGSNSTLSCSFHRFPIDPDIRKKWLHLIHRQQYIITVSSRICSQHFLDTDFKDITDDSNTSRTNHRFHEDLKVKRLNQNALPSIFHGQPSYMTSTPKQKRKSPKTAENRLTIELDRQKILMNDFIDVDNITDFNELVSKIQTCILPSGYEIFTRSEYILCAYVDLSDISPTIQASLRINCDLSVQISVLGYIVDLKHVKHLIKQLKVDSISQIGNLLACVKSFITESTSYKQKINIAVDLLQSSLDDFEEGETENDCKQLIIFMIEQLELCFLQKAARHYSPSLIMNSFLWNMTAPKLYRKLRELFILPTERRLQQLSSDSTVKQCSIDFEYLSRRLSCIPVKDRICILLFDEIYTAKTMEYSNGTFFGATEDGKQAKTVLAFLIQSVCCKYRDVVMLTPVDSLTEVVLKQQFDKVIIGLEKLPVEGFEIVGNSADNHVVNRYDDINIIIRNLRIENL
jgi:hypothetical protein